MAKTTKMTPAGLAASMAPDAAPEAAPDTPAKKVDSGRRLVSIRPPLRFPGIEVPDGAGGFVAIGATPRLVTVAAANALLAIARRQGNEFGLTADQIRVEEE